MPGMEVGNAHALGSQQQHVPQQHVAPQVNAVANANAPGSQQQCVPPQHVALQENRAGNGNANANANANALRNASGNQQQCVPRQNVSSQASKVGNASAPGGQQPSLPRQHAASHESRFGNAIALGSQQQGGQQQSLPRQHAASQGSRFGNANALGSQQQGVPQQHVASQGRKMANGPKPTKPRVFPGQEFLSGAMALALSMGVQPDPHIARMYWPDAKIMDPLPTFPYPSVEDSSVEMKRAACLKKRQELEEARAGSAHVPEVGKRSEGNFPANVAAKLDENAIHFKALEECMKDLSSRMAAVEQQSSPPTQKEHDTQQRGPQVQKRHTEVLVLSPPSLQGNKKGQCQHYKGECGYPM